MKIMWQHVAEESDLSVDEKGHQAIQETVFQIQIQHSVVKSRRLEGPH